MISDALRTDIEVWAAKRDSNPVFAAARAGKLSRGVITRYIANVTHMIRLTPGHLVCAREAATAGGDAKLASFFAHKLEEETGHAVWGEADLVALEAVKAAPMLTQATPAIEQLAAFLPEMIADDPALYLTYLAFTEYITVLLGPELLSLIEERNNVARSALTVIDNHIELDREHAEEAWGLIDDLVGDPRKITTMRAALRSIIELFDAFASEVVVESDRASGVEAIATEQRSASAA